MCYDILDWALIAFETWLTFQNFFARNLWLLVNVQNHPNASENLIHSTTLIWWVILKEHVGPSKFHQPQMELTSNKSSLHFMRPWVVTFYVVQYLEPVCFDDWGGFLYNFFISLTSFLAYLVCSVRKYTSDFFDLLILHTAWFIHSGFCDFLTNLIIDNLNRRLKNIGLAQLMAMKDH